MKPDDRSYPGWGNWQTWAVYTHLTDDEGVYGRCREIVDRHRVTVEAESITPDGLIASTAAERVAAELHEWVEREVVDSLGDDWRSMFQADLAHVALAAVDWTELATVLIESADMPEAVAAS